MNSDVQKVNHYKYLGVVMDNKLSWAEHIQHICKKLNSRLFCLRKMSKFHVNKIIMGLFYNTVLASVWKYCICCWGGNIKQQDQKCVTSIIKRASYLIGEDQETFSECYEGHLRGKLKNILEDHSHPLYKTLTYCVSVRSGRMILPLSNTNRYRNSFIPQALRLFNKEFKRSSINN